MVISKMKRSINLRTHKFAQYTLSVGQMRFEYPELIDSIATVILLVIRFVVGYRTGSA